MKKCSPKKKNKYLALYSHRHGVDLISFSSNKTIDNLNEDEIADALQIEWEPEREEHMDFFYFSKAGFPFPDIDGKTDDSFMPWCEPCQSYHPKDVPGCLYKKKETKRK